MNNESKLGIFISVDLDATLLKGPPPLISMLSKLFAYAEKHDPKPFEIDTRPPGLLKRWFKYFTHKNRMANPDALNALHQLLQLKQTQAAQEIQREIRLAVLTGREPFLHAMTLASLEAQEVKHLFDELLLNLGGSSSAWKVHNSQKKLTEGYFHIHMDDDPRAAILLAWAAEKFGTNRLLVYLRASLATKAQMLWWAGITLPPNVIIVQSLEDAVTDIQQKIAAGSL